MKKEEFSQTLGPVAIVGIGCMFPQAADLEEYWSNIKRGKDAITPIPSSHWSPEDYFDQDPKKPDLTYAQRGGFLKPVEFDPGEFGIAPNAIEATDSAQLLGLVAAGMALRDAGYGPDREFDRSRVSVILGVTGTLQLVIPLGARLGQPIWSRALAEAGVPEEQARRVVERIKEGYVPWQEGSFPGLLGNVVAGRIANRYNLGGTNCVVDAACASSLSALNLAALELSAKRASMVVTGGADCFNDIFMFMCFSKTPALSPTGDIRPFDAKADGTMLGEGLGMLVLKRLDEAERDKDKIYAVIKGLGSSSDGRGKAIYAPSAEGQVKALRAAYETAGFGPDTIGLVEAHGTGTTVGDATEVEALTEVFNESRASAPRATAPWCALGSVKSMIGHTKAAAGAAGVIKAALALHHKVLPATIKVSEPIKPLGSPDSPFYVNADKRPWLERGHPRRAAVSALGFGGSNFHVALEEYQPSKVEADWDGETQIAAFSGPDREPLRKALAGWQGDFSWDEVRVKAANSRSGFDAAARERLCWLIEKGRTDIKATAAAALQALNRPDGAGMPEGVYFGTGKPGKLAVLFPGQGSQYVGMGRDLVCHFPQAFEAFGAAEAEFDGERRLGDFVYPRADFSPEGRKRREAALRDTRIAQPALGAVSCGAYRVLADFNVVPDALAGHSYGELVALCAAGRYDEKVLHQLSALRGKVMAEAGGDGGSMLAVSAPLADIETVIREDKLDLVIANKNAPMQSVLSGRREEIRRASEAFEKRRLRCVELQVSAAFHSPLVEGAQKAFRTALKKIGLRKADIPVYSNKTAGLYPDICQAACDILAGQLASPVEFVGLVENMHSAGVRTYLEAGPGNKVTGLVHAILKGRDHEALALDSSSGRRCGVADLGRVLARLASLGYPVKLGLWQGGVEAVRHLAQRKKPKFGVMLSGANYRAKRQNNDSLPQRNVRPPQGGRADSPPYGGEFVQAAQDSMIALQKLQEQTALLHAKFLEGQAAIQASFQALIEQQQGSSVGRGAEVPLPQPARVSEPAKKSPEPLPPVGSVMNALLSVVSEKTGYPAESLNPDMDLESDLGIDSIKRVEILSAIGEKLPRAPKVKPEHLGTLRTLRRIADYLSQGAAPNGDAHVQAAGRDGLPSAAAVLTAVVSEKTGYPAESLNPDMDLESDLGIDSIKRVEILSAIGEKLPQAPKVKPEHLGALRTLRQIAAYLSQESEPSVPAAIPPAASPEPAKPGVLTRGVLRSVDRGLGAEEVRPKRELPFWIVDDHSGLSQALAENLEGRGYRPRLVDLQELGGLEAPSALAGLVIAAPKKHLEPGHLWDEASEEFLGKAFALARLAAPALRRAGQEGGAAFATVCRLDGAFGLSGLKNEQDPVLGGLSGLSKTALHEWPEVSCKALDVAAGWDDSVSVAEALACELFVRGPIEVGLAESGRKVLELEEVPQPEPATAPLKPGDTVLVVGGARGVTAQAALALARSCRANVALVGRSPIPEPEEAWLKDCRGDADVKKAVLGRFPGKSLKDAGEMCRRVLAAREIRGQLARLQATGVRSLYLQADVLDASAAADAVSRAARELGPVRGLVFGAGVLADKLIADKTQEQFDSVLRTKVVGLRHLLEALDPGQLKVLALYSSSTARFGRAGQSDYAMANEALNKAARLLARRHGGCRVVSFNWGPWDGGMVNDSLRRLFASEGVGVIGLEEGGMFLEQELFRDNRAIEVVVVAKTGRTAAAQELRSSQAPAVLPSPETTFERRLSLEDFPFLISHVINGVPVLPLAFIAEWLAHAALHDNPGLLFAGFDALRVYKGVLLREPGYPVALLSSKAARRDGTYSVKTELRGGKDSVLHASAEIILAQRLAAAPVPLEKFPLKPYPKTIEQCYRDVLFHGPDMRGVLSVAGFSNEGIVLNAAAGLPPRNWMRRPWRDAWLADPMALDAVFQGMILWTCEALAAPSLPSFIGRYRQFQSVYPGTGCQIRAKARKAADGLAAADIDIQDHAGALVARLEGYECTADKSLSAAFRRNQAGVAPVEG